MREPYLTIQTKETKAGPVEYLAIRWWDGNGKKRSKSLGRADQVTQREAKKQLRRLQSEFERDPLKRDTGRVTIKELWSQYKRIRGPELALGTLGLYETSIGYLMQHFGEECPISRITAARAGGFKATLSEGKLSTRKIKAVTLSIHMRALCSVWSYCIKALRLASANPFAGMSKPIKVSRDWHYVPLEELRAMLDVATENFRVMVALTRLAGLRRMEAYWLEWEDVNFEKGRLYVIGKDHWQPKDKESRVVPICPELMVILTEAFNKASEGATRICPSVCVQNIDRDIKATIKRAGVPPFKKPLHSMRKSCLTDWAGRYPLHAVKEWAGHSDISTTEQYYLKVTDDLYDQVVKGEPNRTENVTENEKGVTDSESATPK